MIHDVVLLLRSDAIPRQIRLATDVRDDLPAVYADKVQWQQVTFNLLLNAFDAMSAVSPGECVVSLTLSRERDDMARIAVRDCGHGLTVDEPDSIFKPFHTTKAPWPRAGIVDQSVGRGTPRRAAMGREQYTTKVRYRDPFAFPSLGH